MVSAEGERMDQCSSVSGAQGKGSCGADDGVAGVASSGCAHPHCRTVLYLQRWLRLLVLGADDAPTFHRLERPARELVWIVDLRRGAGRNVVVRLEFGSHQRTPLAFRDPAID